MRHDWYQATIDPPQGLEASQVVECIAGLGTELRQAPGLARMYRYQDGYAVYKDDIGPVAHVFTGGQRGTVHAFASGDYTDEFVHLIRSQYPECHRVTRADAAQDFNESGAYDRVRSSLVEVAERYHVSFLQYQDELDATAGRTQYMGSPRSNCRVRLYEKGLQQQAIIKASSGAFKPPQMKLLNPATGELVEPGDWTRVEAQVRPETDYGKVWLSKASPEEVWACSPWLSDVAQVVLSLNLERFVMTRRKQTTVDKALQTMVSQYRKAILKKTADLGGSPEAFGLHLASVMAEMDRKSRSGMV